jgi:hypothetical protein
MAYGILKVDTITFTDAGVDKSVTISGLVQNPTFSGNITVTGTVSGNTIQGQTVSGATITGGAAAFTTVTGGVATITSGVFALGSASNPSISFTGDNNTGIYSPGADQVAVATNGTGRLFVNSNGDIGLGTSSPDVFGRFYTRAIGLSSSGSTSLQINSATGSTAIIDLGVNSARTAGITSNVSETVFSTLTATPIIFGTNNLERLRITSAGLVGIGTSSVNALLEVNNSTAGGEVQRIEGNYDGSGSVILTNWRRAGGSVAAALKYNDDSSPLCMSIGTTTSHEFRIRTADTDAITIDTSQRVGIGTSSPSALLHCDYTGTRVGSTIGHIATTVHGDASDYTLFKVSNFQGATESVKLFVQGDGKVGVGTTSPGFLLDLFGTTPALRIKANGVASGVKLEQSSATGDVELNVIDVYPLIFKTANTERARIDSSGRLGIGTSSPGATLDIIPTGTNIPLRITSNDSGVVYKSSSAFNKRFQLFFQDNSGTQTAKIGADLSGANASNLQFVAGSGATPQVTLNSSGQVGIGTTSPQAKLEIAQSSDNTDGPKLRIANNGNTLSNGQLIGGIDFFDGDDSGEGVGAYIYSYTTDSIGRASGQDLRFGFLLEGTDAQRRAAVIGADFGGALILGLQKSGAPGGNTIVVNGDGVGEISFQGNDGSEFVACAQIKAEIDNTPGANDMPGRLVFSTTADGAASPTERMRIDSSGRVGIGTASPGSYSAQLAVSGGTLAVVYTESGIELDPQFGFVAGTVRAYDRITSSYKTLGLTGNAVAFGINDVEKARIDSSGRLLVGTSSARGQLGITPGVQSEGTGFAQGTLALTVNSNSGAYPLISLARSGGTSLGSNTIVSNGDIVGKIFFTAADGVDMASAVATIEAIVDGTPGSNDLPGRLVFSTTADGASSPTERMRINNAGYTLLFGDNVLNLASSASAGTSAVLIDASYSATAVGTGTRSFIVYNNGNVLNTNNSYGSLL